MKVSHTITHQQPENYMSQIADAFYKMELNDTRGKFVVLSQGLLSEILENSNDFKSSFGKIGTRDSIWGSIVSTVPMCSMSNPTEIYLYGDDCAELKNDFPVVYRSNTDIVEGP